MRLDRSNSTEDVKLIRVANVQDGVLPLTGGIGVWAVALIGLAIAGAGLFWVRRRL
ncbi:LPXTG cell wall anchor domain-containing protein [Corynebacterium atypicum]|uniref:LPXTG cell wall anchor domain-containing protein n=1 Tax=Corynebacterium atypicum TaxID=191610 RepID=UPI000A4D424F|nr:LPXTG cell wall anchor domain-containing protein [Corynebacterium atypicum]